MQNITDKHVARDLVPFLEKCDQYGRMDTTKASSKMISDSIHIHLTDWSKGHTPPPRAALLYVLERLSRPDLEWHPRGFGVTLAKAERVVKLNSESVSSAK